MCRWGPLIALTLGLQAQGYQKAASTLILGPSHVHRLVRHACCPGRSKVAMRLVRTGHLAGLQMTGRDTTDTVCRHFPSHGWKTIEWVPRSICWSPFSITR